MKVTKITRTELVETYEVDLLPGAPDVDVLDAVEGLAPIESTRKSVEDPFIAWRESPLDEVGAELAATRNAFRRAEDHAKAAIEMASAAGMSEPDMATKLGVNRTTIRRWRGKG